MKRVLKKILCKAGRYTFPDSRSNSFLVERSLMMQGMQLALLKSTFVTKPDSLSDFEFSVFSQWGEDGIIEWLVEHLSPLPQIFIEFGVEDYSEANTRFLLMNRNWRGLITEYLPNTDFPEKSVF